MITLPLRIRYQSAAAPTSGCVADSRQDCQGWLAELLQWETPVAELAVYVVPRSPADLSPLGVLVVVSKGSAPRISHRCQPYVRIGRQGTKHSGAVLYLPAEARFDPDAADAEVTELLGSNENVYLWHPASGLIGFEPGDRRRVADLLQAPPSVKPPGTWPCRESTSASG